jgi:hypothetical protein
MLLPILLALLAAPASASVLPAPCFPVSSGTVPTSLGGLHRCQNKARAAAVAAAASKGTPMTEAQLDELDEFQRAEARKFLAQPGIVTSGKPARAAGGVSVVTKDGASSPGGATPADLSRADPKSAASIQALQERMRAAAGDGKAGITPAMADDVRATLNAQQGGLSPEMSELLSGVQADGGKLTPGTMKKLQSAGKAAKAEGLDLNIDPSVEKSLLETDFDKEKPAGASPPPRM